MKVKSIYPIDNQQLFIRTFKFNIPVDIYIEKEEKNTTTNSKLFHLEANEIINLSSYLKMIVYKYKNINKQLGDENKHILNEEMLLLLAQGLVLYIDFERCKIYTSGFNNQNIHALKLYYNYNEHLYSKKDIKIEINHYLTHNILNNLYYKMKPNKEEDIQLKV